MTDPRLNALIAKWRDNAKEADRLVAHFGAIEDHAGNGYAFLKERRIWTTCADELSAALRGPHRASTDEG